MAPPGRPSDLDRFFAHYQNPILGGAFATQALHYQFILRTQPAIDSGATAAAFKTSRFPRPLKAGLGWAVVFVGLLTRITIAKRSISDHSDPISLARIENKPWNYATREGL